MATNFITGNVPVNHNAIGPSGLQQTVSFVPAFAAAPQVVIPIIKYTAGGTPLLLEAPLILDIQAATFKVQYNASVSVGVDSTEYFLGFMAGDSNAIFSAILQPGIKVPDIPLMAETANVADQVMLVNVSSGKVQLAPISKLQADLGI